MPGKTIQQDVARSSFPPTAPDKTFVLLITGNTITHNFAFHLNREWGEQPSAEMNLYIEKCREIHYCRNLYFSYLFIFRLLGKIQFLRKLFNSIPLCNQLSFITEISPQDFRLLHVTLCCLYTAAAAAKSLQLCPTLCDPIDGSPPGSPVPGILQAETLEWVAISFSNAWKWKVKVKSLSHIRLLATQWTAAYQAPPSIGFSRQEYWSGVPLPSPCLYTKLSQLNAIPCFIKQLKKVLLV